MCYRVLYLPALYSNWLYILHNIKIHSHVLINVHQITKYMNIFGNEHKILVDAYFLVLIIPIVLEFYDRVIFHVFFKSKI